MKHVSVDAKVAQRYRREHQIIQLIESERIYMETSNPLKLLL